MYGVCKPSSIPLPVGIFRVVRSFFCLSDSNFRVPATSFRSGFFRFFFFFFAFLALNGSIVFTVTRTGRCFISVVEERHCR